MKPPQPGLSYIRCLQYQAVLGMIQQTPTAARTAQGGIQLTYPKVMAFHGRTEATSPQFPYTSHSVGCSHSELSSIPYAVLDFLQCFLMGNQSTDISSSLTSYWLSAEPRRQDAALAGLQSKVNQICIILSRRALLSVSLHNQGRLKLHSHNLPADGQLLPKLQ